MGRSSGEPTVVLTGKHKASKGKRAKSDARSSHEKSKIVVSSLTLRLSDASMQRKFVVFLRSQIRLQCKVILGFAVFITIFLGLSSLDSKDSDSSTNQTKVMRLLMLHTGVISLTLGLAIVMSKKWACIVELFGISLMVPTAVIIYLSYSFNLFEMDSKARNIQSNLFILLYFLATNLMSVDYIVHLALRQAFYWACVAVIVPGRDSLDDVVSIHEAVGICVLFSLLFESVLYTNHRAKAILFLRTNVTALQMEQLRSLLDSVPDQVLITTRATENRAPKSLYTNEKMNKFFGCDLVKLEKEKHDENRD